MSDFGSGQSVNSGQPVGVVAEAVAGEEGVEHRRAAVRLVVGAVVQRVGDPELVPGPAAVGAAEEAEGHVVHVALELALASL